MFEAIWSVIALVVFIAFPCLLLHLIKSIPRNEGDRHGGGLEGSGSAWGYAPMESDRNKPPRQPFPLASDPPKESN
jgi:hypothetical protein